MNKTIEIDNQWSLNKDEDSIYSIINNGCDAYTVDKIHKAMFDKIEYLETMIRYANETIEYYETNDI